jgi:hypothetical protein
LSVFRSEPASWAGDNPYIRLYHDGKLNAVASYFRVQYSPHGAGHALFAADGLAKSSEPGRRIWLTDNIALGVWLMTNLVHRFTGFADLTDLEPSALRDATFATADRGASGRAEKITGSGVEVELQWTDLREPVYVEFAHPRLPYTLLSLFVPASGGRVEVDGAPLEGAVAIEQFHGRELSSSCLALAETWLADPERSGDE